MFDLIAFDADDTLWHNENLYTDAQQRFGELLSRYCEPEAAAQILHDAEMRNLTLLGYGVKAFVLSMIEAAIAASEERISAAEIQQLLDVGKDMLGSEVRLLDHAEEALSKLADSYPLMVITKGDLLHQEAKLAGSGLRGYFSHVEIVAEKTRETYKAILAKHNVPPARFLMVGNSPRSDVVPVIELGGWAVHVPYATTWAHEHAELPEALDGRFFEVEHLGALPELVARLAEEPT